MKDGDCCSTGTCNAIEDAEGAGAGAGEGGRDILEGGAREEAGSGADVLCEWHTLQLWLLMSGLWNVQALHAQNG